MGAPILGMTPTATPTDRGVIQMLVPTRLVMKDVHRQAHGNGQSQAWPPSHGELLNPRRKLWGFDSLHFQQTAGAVLIGLGACGYESVEVDSRDSNP